VTLSTTTVISRLSTGSIISASPTPLHFNQGKTGITKLNQLQVVVALLAFGLLAGASGSAAAGRPS